MNNEAEPIVSAGRRGAVARFVLSAFVAFATAVAMADVKVWTGTAGTASLKEGGNWDGGVAPVDDDTLNFSNLTENATIDADFTDGRVFRTALFPDSGPVTLTGSLHLGALTNASVLAVSSTGRLVVDGDIVVSFTASSQTKTFLYSNEGEVRVGGKAIGYCYGKNKSKVYQYMHVTGSTKPMHVGGILHNLQKQKINSSNNGQLSLYMNSCDGEGRWVIGTDNGLSFSGGREADYTSFLADSKKVFLQSAADWTIFGSTQRRPWADLRATGAGSITIDTSDVNDPSLPRTVTLEGRVGGESAGSVTNFFVTGCGTFAVASTSSSYTNYLNTSTFVVGEMATLAFNAGQSFYGNGRFLFDAGTTLSLPANDDRTYTTRDIRPSVQFPSEGEMYIRIDGAKRLRSGTYVLFTGTPVDFDPSRVRLVKTEAVLPGNDSLEIDDQDRLVLRVRGAGLQIIIN